MVPRGAKRKVLDDQFFKLFVKFNVKDLQEHILDFFDEIDWSTIRKTILHYNLSLKMPDIAKVFKKFTEGYSYEDLQNLYYNLLTLDIVLHSSRKQWTAVIMKQNQDDIPLDEDCVNHIVREFRKESMNVGIYYKLEDEIMWILLVIMKRTKSNGIKHQKPCFIARHVSKPYLFYSPKSFNSNVLKIVVSGFGYNDYKICKLYGKNISSLVAMLNKKKKAAQHRTETSLVLKNTVADCVRVSQGLDFCQDKVRSMHAQQILGEDSIKLEKLTIEAGTEWRGLRTLPEAEGKQVDMTLQIKSTNVRQTVNDMIKKGIIQPPYPQWVKEFMISGKNAISIA